MDEATIAGQSVYNSIQAEAGIHGLQGHGRMAGGDPWLHAYGIWPRPAGIHGCTARAHLRAPPIPPARLPAAPCAPRPAPHAAPPGPPRELY